MGDLSPLPGQTCDLLVTPKPGSTSSSATRTLLRRVNSLKDVCSTQTTPASLTVRTARYVAPSKSSTSSTKRRRLPLSRDAGVLNRGHCP